MSVFVFPPKLQIILDRFSQKANLVLNECVIVEIRNLIRHNTLQFIQGFHEKANLVGMIFKS